MSNGQNVDSIISRHSFHTLFRQSLMSSASTLLWCILCVILNQHVVQWTHTKSCVWATIKKTEIKNKNKKANPTENISQCCSPGCFHHVMTALLLNASTQHLLAVLTQQHCSLDPPLSSAFSFPVWSGPANWELSPFTIWTHPSPLVPCLSSRFSSGPWPSHNIGNMKFTNQSLLIVCHTTWSGIYLQTILKQ